MQYVKQIIYFLWQKDSASEYSIGQHTFWFCLIVPLPFSLPFTSETLKKCIVLILSYMGSICYSPPRLPCSWCWAQWSKQSQFQPQPPDTTGRGRHHGTAWSRWVLGKGWSAPTGLWLCWNLGEDDVTLALGKKFFNIWFSTPFRRRLRSLSCDEQRWNCICRLHE